MTLIRLSTTLEMGKGVPHHTSCKRQRTRVYQIPYHVLLSTVVNNGIGTAEIDQRHSWCRYSKTCQLIRSWIEEKWKFTLRLAAWGLEGLRSNKRCRKWRRSGCLVGEVQGGLKSLILGGCWKCSSWDHLLPPPLSHSSRHPLLC